MNTELVQSVQLKRTGLIFHWC